MDGFEDKISALLSSPDAMDKVMSMAKALGASQESAEPEDRAPRGSSGGGLDALAALTSGGGLGGLGELLGGVDPQTIGKIMGLMGEFNKRDDRRETLLNAVKPYLRPERQDKIGKAVQIVKLARTARSALKDV